MAKSGEMKSDEVRLLEQTWATQIGLHSVRNIIGSEQQLSLFSEQKPKEFAKVYGIHLEREISKFGVDLTDIQYRVMEAILLGFSKTRYEGNIEPKDKDQLIKERYPTGTCPNSYKYIEKLPRLRATQSEILEWARISKSSIGDIQSVIEAIKHLGTVQYCFFYTRLALDDEGQPIKDKDGDWKKEEVMAVDTLFTVGFVRDENSQNLKYYEITPSCIFLDQRESYFMLIPYNWREEVRKLVGQKKASSYTFRFLLFLRYQFELKRRSMKERAPYIIKWSSEEVAIAVKMPPSVYKRKKARANKILDDIYSVAKQLGYLSSYERQEGVDLLVLNEEKYYTPRHSESLLPVSLEKDSKEMEAATALYHLFVQEKRRLDPRYNPAAGGPIRKSSIEYLMKLLNERSFDEIKEVLLWGIGRPYWCTRIGTPSKLRKHFHEALLEMKASKRDPKVGREQQIERNKELAMRIALKLEESPSKSSVKALNKYVEIGNDIHPPTCIPYSENGFEEQLESAMRKWGLAIKGAT